MNVAKNDKWRCTECDHICTEATMLEAPNPFCDTAAVHGCPECKAVEQFTRACDIEGCAQDASCGGPSNDGIYRITCGKHADWLHAASVVPGGEKR